MQLVCPGTEHLTTDVRVAPIIAEQTAKLGRFANYLQNWVSGGYCFCGQHRLNLFPSERVCVSPLVELVGQTNQQILVLSFVLECACVCGFFKKINIFLLLLLVLTHALSPLKER